MILASLMSWVFDYPIFRGLFFWSTHQTTWVALLGSINSIVVIIFVDFIIGVIISTVATPFK